MTLTEDRELRRRRLAVLGRAILVVPAAVTASMWLYVVALFVPIGWIVALVKGRVPDWIHKEVRAALGYNTQVNAWLYLVSGRYPWPNAGRRTHPVQLLAEPGRQRRWTVLLRVLLALPATVLGSVLGVVLTGTAIGAWFVGLVLGRTTEGLRELGAFCLRYTTETAAYLLLLTDDYPQLAPRAPAP